MGAGLAAALRDQPIKIGVVETVPISAEIQPSYDDRGLGVAPSSRRILQGIGLWPALENDATPIHHIHVTDRGHFGATHISAEKLGVNELGHIVIGRSLGNVLQRTLTTSPAIELICPATVRSLKTHSDHIEVHIQGERDDKCVTTKLLVIADGGNSVCRDLLGVKTEKKDYQQTAIVSNVTPELPHHNTAFERFTSTGPLALLPSTEQRCVAVWTTTTEHAEDLLKLNETAFLDQLAQRFGHRLGAFIKMGQRRHYPMHLIRAKQLTGPRYTILGNAAHTIHPNAAQGLNLGLRDVAQLAELIVDAIRSHRDIGHPDLLASYAASRRRDHTQVIRFSDGLTRLFYNENPLLITLRNLAMLGVDLLPPAKRALSRSAMGLSGEPPRLVRGLPL